jgi:arylsulfatase A-like enzyme
MPRPNLLLFMPDQARANAFGAFSNPVVQTPNLDALAREGTVFTQAFAQHSVCAQSRASILTGWYPHVAGHRTLTNLLKEWEPNLFRILKDGGYHVAWAGARGDTFAEGMTRASTDRFGFTVPPALDALARAHAFARPRDDKMSQAFYIGCLTEDGDAPDHDEAATLTAIDWITDGLPEPWVLFVAMFAPHPPFAVAEPWFSLHDRSAVPAPVPPVARGKARFVDEIRRRYGTDRLGPDDWAEIIATYYGMVARLDDQLGRVLAALDRSGARERTAVAFFTDHGEYLGDYGLVEKWVSGLDDCLLREPLVLQVPGAPSGRHCDALVEMIDLLPTLLELAEVDAPHTHFGRSLMPLMANVDAAHRDAAHSEAGFLVVEEPLLERAGFPYDEKAALQHDDPTSGGRAAAVRTERFTYVHRLYEGPELYDRVDDPQETTNLAGQPEHAVDERALRDHLLDWLLETSDVVPREQDARFESEVADALFAGARPPARAGDSS